ncbi:hypothetical protein [Planococcus glaciei]|uniref:hypothetical protein n=1 Tax=Planococcus glaciei TaxID=459472 RepID=UPI001F2463DE|nr:hypothetical protein [Planococcus glaciei]
MKEPEDTKPTRSDDLSREEFRRGGGGHRRKERGGAKTFRRGRALEFLARMNTRRDTLKQQLETPELQTIHPVLVGELKAVDMVIAEFTQLFEIHEDEMHESSSASEDKPGETVHGE